MSSILSGGIENIIICPSTTSSITSHSSSPSSTLSESSNSPIAISTRKPRTPRKRPNQTYNEASILLSIACPKVFSTKNATNKNTNLSRFTAQMGNSFLDPPELLLPFPVVETSGKLARPCQFVRGELEYQNCNSGSNSMELGDGFEDDFDTESMLDEEVGEGIDSIMGSPNSISGKYETKNDCWLNSKTCYGYPIGLGFGGNLEFNFGFGMRNGIRALKNGDGGNWWSFPTVNVAAASVAPVEVKKNPVEKKKKKMENKGSKLLLKLNYEDVLIAWSDKGSPLPVEVSGSQSPVGDIHTKLAQIDLFSENDGLREASVIPCKEKKSAHILSKKIRYQVRKVNADGRLRSKGRFVKKPNSPTCEDT